MSKRRAFFVVILFLILLSFNTILPQEPALPTTDDDLKSLIAAAIPTEKDANAEAMIVLDHTNIIVEKSGLGHTNVHYVEKILKDKRAINYSRLRFDYDPMSNIVDVQQVRVIRKDGTIEDVATNQLLDLPQPQDWIIWGPRMKIVRLPRLFAGDALEYKIYKKGFMIAYLGDAEDDTRYIPPMRGHFYDIVFFEDKLPLKLKYYQVSTRKDVPLQYEVYHGEIGSYVTFTKTENIYKFWKKDVPAFSKEELAIAESDLITKVVMATVPDWQTKSRWFYRANDFPWEINPSIKESVFSWDDAIKKKVAEITTGLSTDEEKIAAIVHWAAQEIRYSGITMGPGEGYTIHPGKMIYNDRCGVCKDKAGMAITMLRAAGYEVYPAMTMAGSTVERIPADQFNHCVTALKKKDGSYLMLDPTWVTFSPELWSSAESEQNYVIGTPQGEDLMITPLSPPENHIIKLLSDVTLDRNGNLEGSLKITAYGYSDQRLRRLMVHTARAMERKSKIEEWLAEIAPQAELVSFDIDYRQLLDLYQPITFDIIYRIPQYALVTAGEMQFSPPLSKHIITARGIAPYLTAAQTEKRRQPLTMTCTRYWQVQEKLTLPNGASVVQLPGDIDIDHEAAAISAHYGYSQNELDFQEDLIIKLRTIPVDKYPGFKEVMDKLQQLPEQVIIVNL